MPRDTSKKGDGARKGRGHDASSSVLRSSSGSRLSGEAKEELLRKKLLKGLKKREDSDGLGREPLRAGSPEVISDSSSDSAEAKPPAVPDRRQTMFSPAPGSGLSAFGQSPTPATPSTPALTMGMPKSPFTSAPTSPATPFSFTSSALLAPPPTLTPPTSTPTPAPTPAPALPALGFSFGLAPAATPPAAPAPAPAGLGFSPAPAPAGLGFSPAPAPAGLGFSFGQAAAAVAAPKAAPAPSASLFQKATLPPAGAPPAAPAPRFSFVAAPGPGSTPLAPAPLAAAPAPAPAVSFGRTALSAAAGGLSFSFGSAAPSLTSTPTTPLPATPAPSSTPYRRPPPLKNKQPTPEELNTVIPVTPAQLATCRLPGVLEDSEATPLTPTPSKALRGTLDAMISPTELRDRDVTMFERDPVNGSWDMAKAIAAYSRSDSGKKIDPAMVRTPRALNHSFTYLVDNVVDCHMWKPDIDFMQVYHFTRDRLRAISQEFSVQSLVSEARIKVMEMSTRFFILADHLLCQLDDNAAFSSQQNNERLSDCLTTLKALYRDSPVRLPTQPEFACYSVLHQLGQALERNEALDFQTFLQQLPSWVLGTPEIDFALEVFNACFQGLYAKFFRLMRRASYLQACMMHMVVATVRTSGLKVLHKACLKGQPIMAVRDFVELFGFDDERDALLFLGNFRGGLQVRDGRIERAEGPLRAPASAKGLRRTSHRLIEAKRHVGYSDACPVLMNRHLMQGIDRCPLNQRAALLAKDAERQRGIRRPEDKLVYKRDSWVTLDGSGGRNEGNRIPSPISVVNPFKQPTPPSERRVHFQEEGPDGRAQTPRAPAALSAVNPFGGPGPFGASGPFASPALAAPAAPAAATGGFSFSAVRTPGAAPAAPTPAPAPPAAFSFSAAAAPSAAAQPPSLAAPTPAAPSFVAPSPPRPTPSPALAPAPPATAPPPLAFSLTGGFGLAAPSAAAPDASRASTPERPPVPTPPAAPSPGLEAQTPPPVERDLLSELQATPPAAPAEAEAPPPIEAETTFGAAAVEEAAPPGKPRRPVGSVGREGVVLPSHLEREAVMGAVVDATTRWRAEGGTHERLKVLVGDGKECPVAPRLEQGWLAAPARAALDVPALLAADVGRLDTLPITLAGRKDLRLSWEVVVLSEQPIEATEEDAREPRLAQWLVDQLMAPEAEALAAEQEVSELDNTLRPLALYEVSTDLAARGMNVFHQGGVIIDVAVRHGLFQDVALLPGLCLLVYVCDHDLPADDPAGQFDALIDRLPFSAASDQGLAVPPALLLVHDDRLLPAVYAEVVRSWDGHVGGVVLSLNVSLEALERFKYDSGRCAFRFTQATTATAMEDIPAEAPSNALALGLQTVFRHTAEWLNRRHTAYRCDLGPLFEECLEACFPQPPRLGAPTIARDLRRLLTRPVQSPHALVDILHVVLNAVFKQLGDAVGELQYLFCTIATPESAKPLRAGDLCDWLGTLSLPQPTITPPSDRRTTYEVEAVWHQLSEYNGQCLQDVVRVIETLAGPGEGLLGQLGWHQVARLVDGKAAACLDAFVQRCRTDNMGRGNTAAAATDTCFEVLRVLGDALVGMLDQCGIVLYSCSPPEDIAAVVRARATVKDTTLRRGNRSALEPFLETGRRMRQAAAVARNLPAPTPRAPAPALSPLDLERMKRARSRSVTPSPLLPDPKRVAATPAAPQRKPVPQPKEPEPKEDPYAAAVREALTEGQEERVALLDNIDRLHEEVQAAVRRCRGASVAVPPPGEQVDCLTRAIEEELRIWEGSDADLMQTESEPAVFDNHDLMGTLESLDALLGHASAQRATMGSALLRMVGDGEEALDFLEARGPGLVAVS